jgi:hypothetical protein
MVKVNDLSSKLYVFGDVEPSLIEQEGTFFGELPFPSFGKKSGREFGGV